MFLKMAGGGTCTFFTSLHSLTALYKGDFLDKARVPQFLFKGEPQNKVRTAFIVYLHLVLFPQYIQKTVCQSH